VTEGCGAIVVNHATGALGHQGVAASFGLVIMVMIAAVGHLSGAHFNPAVTVAFALARHFRWRDVPADVSGQMLGAVSGVLALRGFFGLKAGVGATVPSGSPLRTLGWRLSSPLLMFVITSVATDTRAVGHLAALPSATRWLLMRSGEGRSPVPPVNPARYFGPALVAGVWRDQWISGSTGLVRLVGASLGAAP
jgi:glycerol uptake facilitator-like aquaporin